MKITTFIALPPGPINNSVIPELLNKIIMEFHWLNPDKYGHIIPDMNFNSKEITPKIRELIEFYTKHGDLELSEKNSKARISINPNRFNRKSFKGYIIWEVNHDNPELELGKHFNSVASIMKLINSPVSYASSREAYEYYSRRYMPSEHGQQLVFTVRDYTFGLENAHWRMWFSKEYSDFFGAENILNCPSFYTNRFEEINFIQIFEDLKDWNNKMGMEAISAFKRCIAKNSFYDPEFPDKILEAPNFEHLL